MKSQIVTFMSAVIVSSFLFSFSATADVSNRIDPASLEYLGAFKMPTDYSYGGWKIAINPAGNGGSGSLFAGRGTEGNGGYLGEVTIPAPLGTGATSSLPRASIIQSKITISTAAPQDTQGQPAYSEPRGSQTAAKIYTPSYTFYNVDNSLFTSLGWVNANLSSPNQAGSWNITSTAGSMVNKVGGYAFFVPQPWADKHTSGRSLIVGYHRGFANQSSNGPTMFATAPWAVGNPPSSGTNIPSTELLRYPSIDTAEGGTSSAPITNFTDYSMSHHAKGGAWVEWGGKRAVLFVGIAGTNSSYCYGSSCSSAICTPRQGPNNPPYSPKFWWYDVDDFEAVAAGTLDSDEPSPYYEQTPSEAYNNSCATDFYQSVAFDETTGRIYAAEPISGGEVAIHVYQVDGDSPTPTYSYCIDADNDNYYLSGSCSNYGSDPGGTYILQSSADGVDCDDTDDKFTFDCEGAGDRQVYVDTLSELYAAFDGERDGDEIVIASGTYTLNSAALSIDAPNVIVRGATGKRDDVIILGDAMTSGANIKSIFYFPQGAYGQNATIKDLTVGRVGWHALFFNGNGSGNGTTIDNVRIFNTYEQMVKGAVGTSGTSNVTIKNCLFEFTTPPLNYYTGGIDAHSASGWVIQNNVFKNIKSPNTSVAEHAIHLWSNTDYSGSNTIERNKIINCDRGIGIWHNSGVATIRNNMITSDGSGTFPDVGIDIQDSQNSKIYNNTVWMDPSGYYAAMEIRDTTTTGVVLTNNLTNKEIAIFSGVGATKTTNVENAQSLWFNSTETGDLHLSSSVATVTGRGTTIEGLIDDFDGEPRSGSIDIGADQLNQNILPPPNVKIN
ncbi:hypothetical protein SAMN05660420_02106 [Desulfuromusa kysingii]|uniref:Periplasmic copper-binding protein NosD beta helix domain-containing protein n=1 Tax=Desulfuromusa kysingii TaxID=37625 RepID=A0A1H4BAP4_9BACT|nr:right-handed parallel beta-helix repeat-containing protein [Desulfuromusa kysingii]SEA45166.1 hypothetical protein SAMN05660420_02106 [Desulfuromusa kysingii]